VSPPPLFFVFLVGATAAYLGLVEFIKGLFYHATRNATPLPTGQL
jgi:Mg2+-importing ATPase